SCVQERHVQTSSAAALSAISIDDMGDVWPEVSARAIGGLVARGIDRDRAADAVQEAAVRALRHRPDVASVDELARWVFVVARNSVIDKSRRRLRTVPLEDLDRTSDE